MGLLRGLSNVNARAAAAELAGRVVISLSLNDPRAVAELLELLWRMDEHDSIQVLLARDPAATTRTGGQDSVASLLAWLRIVRARHQVQILTDRIVNDVGLTDLTATVRMLENVRRADLPDRFHVLATRAVGEVVLGDRTDSAALLVDSLHKARAWDQVEAFACRLSAAGMFELSLTAWPPRKRPFRFGRRPEQDLPAERWGWDDLE
ncbi:hypothetical protein ACIA5E_18120 [Nocardia asteroides]|uniref:hypothetical protein n=1 Tax=Nocardia asteroides TaxID=1824 RepID=UPI0037BE0834